MIELKTCMVHLYNMGGVLKHLKNILQYATFYFWIGDTLLVGTKQGHLLVYTVRASQGRSDVKFDVSLERSNKSFAKKPIMQLAVVPEYHILISLSGKISYYYFFFVNNKDN